MREMERVVEAVRQSECYKAEVRYAERGGHYKVIHEPRLYKVLEENLVRVVFPVEFVPLEEGTVIAVTTLYDLAAEHNIYGHTICAGPGVNVLLKSSLAPLGGAHPQAGNAGLKAIQHFVAWKQASWGKFLNDELEHGPEKASRLWVHNFWKALDRMFGGGYLVDYPLDKMKPSMS